MIVRGWMRASYLALARTKVGNRIKFSNRIKFGNRNEHDSKNEYDRNELDRRRMTLPLNQDIFLLSL